MFVWSIFIFCFGFFLHVIANSFFSQKRCSSNNSFLGFGHFFCPFYKRLATVGELFLFFCFRYHFSFVHQTVNHYINHIQYLRYRRLPYSYISFMRRPEYPQWRTVLMLFRLYSMGCFIVFTKGPNINFFNILVSHIFLPNSDSI